MVYYTTVVLLRGRGRLAYDALRRGGGGANVQRGAREGGFQRGRARRGVAVEGGTGDGAKAKLCEGRDFILTRFQIAVELTR